mmetsp:Transcript_11300/g.30412  ORF Transcript_11300/g.30412 Transcript_11300/m.30412 type:complete len:260 (-) Transcript_11300:607-1386(-)
MSLDSVTVDAPRSRKKEQVRVLRKQCGREGHDSVVAEIVHRPALRANRNRFGVLVFTLDLTNVRNEVAHVVRKGHIMLPSNKQRLEEKLARGDLLDRTALRKQDERKTVGPEAVAVKVNLILVRLLLKHRHACGCGDFFAGTATGDDDIEQVRVVLTQPKQAGATHSEARGINCRAIRKHLRVAIDAAEDCARALLRPGGAVAGHVLQHAVVPLGERAKAPVTQLGRESATHEIVKVQREGEVGRNIAPGCAKNGTRRQ